MTSDLEKFGTAVNDAAELFATAPSTAGEKKVALSKQSLLVVQSILDGHLSSESTTLPLYMTMLQHITSSRPTTRSAAKRKSHSDQVKPTPLSQFYIPEEEQESDNELVWQQMQMRLDTLQAVLSNLLGRQDFGVDTEQQLEDSSASEPEDQEEDEITDEESSESDLDEAESTLPLNHSAFLSSPSAQNSATSPSKTTRANKRKAKSSPVDDTFFHLDDFLRQSEAGEAQMARSLQQSNRTDQDSDEDDDDDDVDLFAEVEMDNEDDNDLNGGDTEDLQDIQGTLNFMSPMQS